MYKLFGVLLFFSSIITCLTPRLGSEELTINEIMASNSSTIRDEDGDYPDWLELYNAGNDPIDLNGNGLSDDVDDHHKWVFPNMIIQPKGYLLIFASDKDRRVLITHWETIIDRGDVWKYRSGDSNIPLNWTTLNYNDAAWLSGPSGFGYGDGDDATVVSKTNSLYIRKIFTINDLNNIADALLHIDYDDAFVAYLNGVEIARSNIGIVGTPPSFNQPAAAGREAAIYAGGYPEKYRIDSIRTRLQQGDNVLTIQVHNTDMNSSDLSLIPFFTLGMLTPPENPSDPPEILHLQLPALHTNFKIRADGETLLISQPDGTIIDLVQPQNIPTDLSWGRRPDGSADGFLFSEPTPGTSNDNQGYLQVAKDPLFSPAGGFYPGSVTVKMTTDSPNATIHYTLDGSEPNESSGIYTHPIPVALTTVVRARAMGPNVLPGKIITHTYLVNTNSSLPVFSLATAPANLFDIDTGIYTLGRSYNYDNPYEGANFWQDWERPVHVEFFEKDGEPGFSLDAGVKIVGGWSRANPQKPLAIFARNEYGAGEINYQLFPDRPFDSFQAFILRNGGNDWGRTFFSDGLMHGLVENLDMDVMAFRPCLVYINGQYWGILNLREKQNEHYIAMHHDVDPDSIDLLELDANPIQGDARHYNMLIDFISSHDLSQTANYEYVKTLMDIDNFIDYNVAQIYFDNRDWPGNNIKYWRPRTANGQWRWLLYDTDWGFGVNAYGRGGNVYSYNYNTLEYATSPQATPNLHANQPWSTLLLRSLLNNKEFRDDFINRFADYFNTIFQPEVVIDRISKIQEIMKPEMQQHISKWSQSYPQWSRHRLWWNDMNSWYNYIGIMVDFARNRISCMRNHIIKKFNLGGNATLSLDVTPGIGGLIKISTIVVENYPWQGDYFMNVPIRVSAIPNANYHFSGWKGFTSSNADSISIMLSGNTTLIAVFEPKSGNRESVVINEINYHSNSEFNPDDWLELYNSTETAIDISAWQLRDSEDHFFRIPDNTVLKAHEYIVLCRNSSFFQSCFPNVSNIFGNLDFGFERKGESIRLFNKANELMDSLTYSNRHPWPTMPDGGGPTLALKNPEMDNSLSVSWIASKEHGSPGAQNNSDIEQSVNSFSRIPDEFRLYPNFPNPFNPTTTISFHVPELASVNISIYNVRGQLVEEFKLINVQPGYHSLNWDAHQMSSGIYIYKLSVGKLSAVGKCLLLR